MKIFLLVLLTGLLLFSCQYNDNQIVFQDQNHTTWKWSLSQGMLLKQTISSDESTGYMLVSRDSVVQQKLTDWCSHLDSAIYFVNTSTGLGFIERSELIDKESDILCLVRRNEAGDYIFLPLRLNKVIVSSLATTFGSIFYVLDEINMGQQFTKIGDNIVVYLKDGELKSSIMAIQFGVQTHKIQFPARSFTFPQPSYSDGIFSDFTDFFFVHDNNSIHTYITFMGEPGCRGPMFIWYGGLNFKRSWLPKASN